MADTKISGLTADATPTSDDLLVTVNDPGGTPANRKTTIDNLDDYLKASTKALSNKTIDLSGNTVTGTAAEFDTACSDDNFAFVSDNLSVFAATTSAQLAGVISDETGSGALVFGTSPSLTTPDIGTPSAGTLTSCTGLPISTGVSGLGANVATFLATPSSANLATAVTDETGSGALVFATSPTLVTPALGTPTSGTLTSCSGLPASGLVSGTLAEDVLVSLDTTLSADGKYCGYGQYGTAGAALSFGEVVYYAVADSKWEKTDADASATAGPVKLGIVVVAAAEDASVGLMFNGVIREDDWNWGTIGAPVYLDTATAGGLTQTAPSGSGDIVRIVGYAKTADSIWFCPDTSWVEIA